MLPMVHGLSHCSMIQSPYFDDEVGEEERGKQERVTRQSHSYYLVSSSSERSITEDAAPLGAAQTQFSCSRSS
jgi:hypothetical protein